MVALNAPARPGRPTFLGHVGLEWYQGTGDPVWVPGFCWRSAGLTPCVRASRWDQSKAKAGFCFPRGSFPELGAEMMAAWMVSLWHA